jgi:hypothetical protein
MYCVYWIHLPEHTDPYTQGYIGISKDTARRLIEHKCYKKNAHLSNAMAKYDNIQMTIMHVAPKEECISLEHLYRPCPQIGWNIAEGGGIPPSPKGKKQSADTIAKRVATRKATYIHTEETKQQISATLSGRKKPPEVIAKRSATRTGKKRKPFTPEHKEAMRKAALARYQRENQT